MSKPILQIIIGSTRPGRVGASVAEWFATRASADDRFEIEVVDLAEVNLPLMDEPNHPRLREYTQPHTQRWSERVDRGDAYVFVIPEYNYALNAATKNALDFLHEEWARKPLGIVSYGGISGGLRAAQMLKQVGSAMRMLVTNDIVIVPWVRELIEEGRFVPTQIIEDSASVLLDELEALSEASFALRSPALR